MAANSSMLHKIIRISPMLLLSYFTMKDANSLRLLSKEFTQTVKEYSWVDGATPVANMMKWRRAFPRALACQVSPNPLSLVQGLMYLKGLKWINLENFNPTKFISDWEFWFMEGVETLIMGENSITVNDAKLCQINSKIKTLTCRASYVTDSGLSALKGIRTLSMSGHICATDASLANLAGIKSLSLFGTSHATWFTDRGISLLNANKALQELRLCSLGGLRFTDQMLYELRGIELLHIVTCTEVLFSDLGIEHLNGIQELVLNNLSGLSLTDVGISHLAGISRLTISFCDNVHVTDAGVAKLAGIHELDFSYCQNIFISDAGATALAGIGTLCLRVCPNVLITNEGILALSDINFLDLYLTNSQIDDEIIAQMNERGSTVIYGESDGESDGVSDSISDGVSDNISSVSDGFIDELFDF